MHITKIDFADGIHLRQENHHIYPGRCSGYVDHHCLSLVYSPPCSSQHYHDIRYVLHFRNNKQPLYTTNYPFGSGLLWSGAGSDHPQKMPRSVAETAFSTSVWTSHEPTGFGPRMGPAESALIGCLDCARANTDSDMAILLRICNDRNLRSVSDFDLYRS